MKVLVCPSCGYHEETRYEVVVAMPKHPPEGRTCPGSGAPVQPMLRSRPVSAAQYKAYQKLTAIYDKMIVAQRAQAAAYRQLEELRAEADAAEKELRNAK